MTSRLERLLALDAYIRGGTRPGVEQLSRMYEVKPRTVYQDLKELRERFGLDIRYDRERSGYYNADPNKRLPHVALSREELMLLLTSIEMLCRIGGESFRGGFANAVQTLVGDRDPELMDDITNAFQYDHDVDEASRTKFLTLLQCALKRIRVRITSVQKGKQVTATVLPQRVMFSKGRWKVAALGNPTKHTLQIALADIVSYEPLEPTGLSSDEGADDVAAADVAADHD